MRRHDGQGRPVHAHRVDELRALRQRRRSEDRPRDAGRAGSDRGPRRAARSPPAPRSAPRARSTPSPTRATRARGRDRARDARPSPRRRRSATRDARAPRAPRPRRAHRRRADGVRTPPRRRPPPTPARPPRGHAPRSPAPRARRDRGPSRPRSAIEPSRARQRERHLRGEPRVHRAVRPGDDQATRLGRAHSSSSASARIRSSSSGGAPSWREDPQRVVDPTCVVRAHLPGGQRANGVGVLARDDAPLDEIAEAPHPPEALRLGEPLRDRAHPANADRSEPLHHPGRERLFARRGRRGHRLDRLAVVGHELEQQHQGLGIRGFGEQRPRHRAPSFEHPALHDREPGREALARLPLEELHAQRALGSDGTRRVEAPEPLPARAVAHGQRGIARREPEPGKRQRPRKALERRAAPGLARATART